MYHSYTSLTTTVIARSSANVKKGLYHWLCYATYGSLVSNKVIITCIWNVDPRLYRNNRARYSRKTEVKARKLPQKETKIQETQVILQSPEMLGNSKTFFSANSAHPVRQVLLEIHSSDTRVLVSDRWLSGSFLPWI